LATAFTEDVSALGQARSNPQTFYN